jgi:hypothetical protein
MESQSKQDATKCATQILDAKYNKADLQSSVKENCKQLSANQQKKLLQLLSKMSCFLMALWVTGGLTGLLPIEGKRIALSQPSFSSTKHS